MLDHDDDGYGMPGESNDQSLFCLDWSRGIDDMKSRSLVFDRVDQFHLVRLSAFT